MRTRFPRIFLAAAFLFFGAAIPAGAQDAAAPADPAAAAAPPDCPLKIYARIEMFDLPNGLVAIPVKIEDQDLYFMLDTGGVINTISQDVVTDMKLTPVPTSRRLIGVGRSMNSYVVPKSFSLGPMSGSDMLFFVEPLTIPGLAGALAPDTMRNFDVDFDFAGGKFSIFSPDHCPDKVVYWTKDAPIAAIAADIDRDGHVRIPVMIDGKEVIAALDTGADFSFMNKSAASHYFGIDENTQDVVERDRNINNARHKTYTYPFQAMDIAGVAVDKPALMILEDEDMLHLGADVVLGMNVLKQLHIYIAYRDHKIYVTPAAAH